MNTVFLYGRRSTPTQRHAVIAVCRALRCVAALRSPARIACNAKRSHAKRMCIWRLKQRDVINPVANEDVRQLCPFSVNRLLRRNCATQRRMRIDFPLDVEGKTKNRTKNENNGFHRHKRLMEGWGHGNLLSNYHRLAIICNALRPG